MARRHPKNVAQRFATILFLCIYESASMQMYFEVSDKNSVDKIKQALLGQSEFYKNLDAREKKYGAETSLIFHTLQRGLSFSCLWFKQEDKDKIDNTLFKITPNVRNKSTGEYGHEARPRKANKKFYTEFMKGIEDFSYLEFCKVILGVNEIPYGGLGIEFKERDDKYYFAINRDIVVAYREITASEYDKA